jgi:hypothetical protein
LSGIGDSSKVECEEEARDGDGVVGEEDCARDEKAGRDEDVDLGESKSKMLRDGKGAERTSGQLEPLA